MTQCRFEFPCSIGEKVWCITPAPHIVPRIREETVDRFVIHGGDVAFIITESGVYLRSEVFASKQEAEQVLKEGEKE